MEEIIMDGLREHPNKGEGLQDNHMMSVLQRLFPEYDESCWIVNKGIHDGSGKCYHKPGNPKSFYKPDFRNDKLKIIIEVDGAGGKYPNHFSDPEKCKTDIEKAELYESLGYKAVFIPPYIQLDAEMVKYYFGIDYPVKLYPAASEHGFAHPKISLPAMFCKLGADRFCKDMDSLPVSVREKIVQTLKERIAGFEKEGFSHEDAMAKVLLPSMWKYVE